MKLASLAAVCAAFLSAPALAASITVSTFSVSNYNAVAGGFGASVVEDFESFSEGNVADGFATAVGTFSSVGGTGSGGTVSGADFDNDGSLLAIRDGNVFGRSSTTKLLTGDASDDKFLDSNDTHGIAWAASIGGSAFNKILLTLKDATDVGATMQISAAGETVSFSGLGNANTQMVLIDFGTAVTGADILFENFRGGNYTLNDGFSLDDVAVAAVPLPASALLMLTGLAATAALRRRRT